MAKKPSFGWIAALLAVAFVIGFIIWNKNQPGQHDALAQCLKANGAVFYGAFWCPHCQSQKSLFGKSARLLNYVECSTPNGQGQTIACQEKGVQSYPTWIFANGEKLTGELSLQQLAEKTGCTVQ